MVSLIERKGCLEGTILSIYDLPVSEQPVAVTVTACGITVRRPPLFRQKDRNSFRFALSSTSTSIDNNNNSNSNNDDNNKDVFKLVASLRELYQSNLKIEVVYKNERNNLEAEIPLQQLRVHENKWLILNLSTITTTSNDRALLNIDTDTDTNTNTTNEEDMFTPPTIRIKLKLSGPYRSEIAAILNLAQVWFDVVDRVQYGVQSKLRNVVPTIPYNYRNLMLLPAVPIVAVIVVASPVIAGVVLVAVPILLPLVLLIIGIVASVIIAGGILYVSTKQGRHKVSVTVGPFVEHIIFSRPGQVLVYDTGPRPTPVSVCCQIVPTGVWSKLWISLLIDLIGSSSYLLPVVGEAFDLGWAPAQTILIMAMYDSTSPTLKYVSFLEEIMPFTDIVPSATIGWVKEFFPILWNEHNTQIKNVVVPVPKVTQAVTQLITTAPAAANGTMTRKRS